jgi:two-component system chemotaxis response regulator CheY
MAYNILIVDDSTVVKAVMVNALGQSGISIHEIFDAANGQDALKILENASIDLVFADINMPIMSGVEMVERMSADERLKKIPVIIISTEGSATRMEYLREKGVKAYVRKPFTAEQIHAAVRTVMESMAEKPEDNLAQALESVIKTMASLPVEIIDPRDLPDMDAPLLHAHIGFAGEVSGEIGLLFDPALATLLAARILGIESGDQLLEDMIEDAIKELLNVVCGQFLTMSFGETPVFSLTVPHVFTLGAPACRALLKGPHVISFLVNGYTLLGHTRIKPAAR